MSDQLSGLPVAGYRPQTTAAVDLVNENKRLEEEALRAIDRLAMSSETDQRWLDAGRMLIEMGWMMVNRAVFQPSRVKLEGDDA